MMILNKNSDNQK